jgi:putative addiction module CopG family antidote
MIDNYRPEVESLIRVQMATGRYANEDDLLREALKQLTEADADFHALEEALDAMDAGDEGTPLDEAIAAIKAKHTVALT